MFGFGRLLAFASFDMRPRFDRPARFWFSVASVSRLGFIWFSGGRTLAAAAREEARASRSSRPMDRRLDDFSRTRRWTGCCCIIFGSLSPRFGDKIRAAAETHGADDERRHFSLNQDQLRSNELESLSLALLQHSRQHDPICSSSSSRRRRRRRRRHQSRSTKTHHRHDTLAKRNEANRSERGRKTGGNLRCAHGRRKRKCISARTHFRSAASVDNFRFGTRVQLEARPRVAHETKCKSISRRNTSSHTTK